MPDNPTNDLIMRNFASSYFISGNTLIYIKDANLAYVSCTKEYAQLFGKESEREFIGLTDEELLGAKAARQFTEIDKHILMTGEAHENIISSITGASGIKRLFNSSIYPIWDEEGTVIGVYGVVQVVQPQRIQAGKRERDFVDVIELDLDLGIIRRAEGRILSPVIHEADDNDYSRALTEVVRRFLSGGTALYVANRYSLQALRDACACNITEFTDILRLTGSGDKAAELVGKIRKSDSDGHLSFTLLLRMLGNEFGEDGNNDELTGLLNGKTTMERISECITGYGVTEQHVMLYVDLDDFNGINKRYGREVGDTLLKCIARELKNIFRDGDIIGRVGGDEFVVLAKYTGSKNAIELKLSNHFRNRLYRIDPMQSVRATCSVGGALYAGDGKPVDKLASEADAALTLAKRNGKNTIRFF